MILLFGLIDRLIDWLVNCLAVWLIDWSAVIICRFPTVSTNFWGSYFPINVSSCSILYCFRPRRFSRKESKRRGMEDILKPYVCIGAPSNSTPTSSTNLRNPPMPRRAAKAAPPRMPLTGTLKTRAWKRLVRKSCWKTCSASTLRRMVLANRHYRQTALTLAHCLVKLCSTWPSGLSRPSWTCCRWNNLREFAKVTFVRSFDRSIDYLIDW